MPIQIEIDAESIVNTTERLINGVANTSNDVGSIDRMATAIAHGYYGAPGVVNCPVEFPLNSRVREVSLFIGTGYSPKSGPWVNHAVVIDLYSELSLNAQELGALIANQHQPDSFMVGHAQEIGDRSHWLYCDNGRNQIVVYINNEDSQSDSDSQEGPTSPDEVIEFIASVLRKDGKLTNDILTELHEIFDERPEEQLPEFMSDDMPASIYIGPEATDIDLNSITSEEHAKILAFMIQVTNYFLNSLFLSQGEQPPNFKAEISLL